MRIQSQSWFFANPQPKSPGITKNIDLICLGVEYLAAPRHLKGLNIVEATTDEIEDLSGILGKQIEPSNVRVISSEGHRYPIVAASFSISENDADIFSSPFN